MKIDESGWHDLNERLASLGIAADERSVLIDHLVHRLIGHFGAESVEVHLGKDDPRRHAMREVAAAAIAHLAPVLRQVPDGAIAELIESGQVGTPVPPPWNDRWRTDPRTASWRS